MPIQEDNDKDMKYAPILIHTLDRSKHLADCIRSLQKNTHARDTDLYISVDYPPSEKFAVGNSEIKALLSNGIEGFHKTYVFFQKENLGPSENGRFIREKAFEYYDRFIATEDDNVFSPCFLDYIDKGFDLYNDDDSVIALCGHSYPINWPDRSRKTDRINTLFDAWGYGMTRKDYLNIRSYIEDKLEERLRDPANMKKLYKKQSFIFQCADSYLRGAGGDMLNNGRLRMMDQTIAMYMILEKKHTIMPHISLVRNMGDDGSGIHGGENPARNSWSEQEIERGDTFDFQSDDSGYDKRLDRRLNKYIELGLKAKIRNLVHLTYMI